MCFQHPRRGSLQELLKWSVAGLRNRVWVRIFILSSAFLNKREEVVFSRNKSNEYNISLSKLRTDISADPENGFIKFMKP